jgi:hypothetical protein
VKIYKYPLAVTDTQTVLMPRRFRVLSVGTQTGGLFVWALVDETTTETVLTKFLVVGTGNPADAAYHQATFIGTVQMPPFVWHVFVDTWDAKRGAL